MTFLSRIIHVIMSLYIINNGTMLMTNIKIKKKMDCCKKGEEADKCHEGEKCNCGPDCKCANNECGKCQCGPDCKC